MQQISDEQFEELIGQALDELPKEYVSRLLKDVAVTWQDEPTPEQRTELKLHCNQTLYGLYEGRPLTERYSGYDKIVPDKITIFKNPIVAASPDMHVLKGQIKHTVWHEMAHFFGLDHKRIHELE
jgi:predicted Zn-dependent protease with MMP-like domain